MMCELPCDISLALSIVGLHLTLAKILFKKIWSLLDKFKFKKYIYPQIKIWHGLKNDEMYTNHGIFDLGGSSS